MKTKAAILTKLNSPLEIMDLNIPKLNIGHVLVDIKCASLCGSQLSEISGYKNNEKFLPHLLGHEGGGIVLEIGQGITKVKPGDRVVLHWRKGSGIEGGFVKYDKIGAGKITTFCTKAIISENRLTKVSNNIPFELCSLLGCAITTAFGIVNYEANIKIGESTLVLGCGGIGITVIKALSIVGSSPIDCYDIKNKEILAKRNGANNFLSIIKDKYDIIIDTICDPKLFNQCINYLNSNGKYIIAGQPKPQTDLTISNITNMFGEEGKTIITTNGGRTNPDIDIPKYCQAFLHNVFDYKSLITAKYNLENINDAITDLKQNIHSRIILTI